MKIILATRSIYPFHPFGGMQKYVYHLAKYLTSEGVEVEIVAPQDKGKPRSEIFEGITFTFLAPPVYKYLEYPIGWLGVHLFSRNLAQYLKGKDFDLLHSFDMTGYQYLKQKDHKSVVTHIFSDNYLCNPISWMNIFDAFGYKTGHIKKEKIKISPFSSWRVILKYPFQYFLKIKPIQLCLKRSKVVLVEGDIFKQEVSEIFRIPPEKCQVVAVGTDMDFIENERKKKKVARAKIGLKDSDIVLLTVNRLAADKGIDKIILALDEIRKEAPNIKLLIVGQGYQENELLGLVAEKKLEGHVRHFKDVQEDELYGIYSLADIYVCAFSYPGSSVSSLEAMACGLPILTTAQPWLVKSNQNGAVLESNDPGVIKKAVLDLIKTNQLKVQGKVSQEVIKNYDWKHIIKDLIKRYESVLKEK